MLLTYKRLQFNTSFVRCLKTDRNFEYLSQNVAAFLSAKAGQLHLKTRFMAGKSR